MNNISFVLPTRNSIQQAYYQGTPGIFTLDFPPIPPVQFNYTGNVSRGLRQPVQGSKLYKLKFGSTVQIILQGTRIFTIDEHPMHLHGYHFYVIGRVRLNHFSSGTLRPSCRTFEHLQTSASTKPWPSPNCQICRDCQSTGQDKGSAYMLAEIH
ncbi:Laccase-3-like protein [Drosera capensis]